MHVTRKDGLARELNAAGEWAIELQQLPNSKKWNPLFSESNNSALGESLSKVNS